MINDDRNESEQQGDEQPRDATGADNSLSSEVTTAASGDSTGGGESDAKTSDE